tara:strand:- start:44 stop:256 length:213 start_codon:yes stop_codon:yes gene_type:complete
MIFLKSFNAPLFKCGIDSATTDISKLGVCIALLINTGSMPNVFPADVNSPPHNKVRGLLSPTLYTFYTAL